jgi:hypothetical protein
MTTGELLLYEILSLLYFTLLLGESGIENRESGKVRKAESAKDK